MLRLSCVLWHCSLLQIWCRLDLTAGPMNYYTLDFCDFIVFVIIFVVLFCLRKRHIVILGLRAFVPFDEQHQPFYMFRNLGTAGLHL